MEKRVEDIVQAFEHYRFEDALRQIDQLMKKAAKDSKKKSSLSEMDNRTVQIMKCGSLASLGRIHEANQIIGRYSLILRKLLHIKTTQLNDRQVEILVLFNSVISM